MKYVGIVLLCLGSASLRAMQQCAMIHERRQQLVDQGKAPQNYFDLLAEDTKEGIKKLVISSEREYLVRLVPPCLYRGDFESYPRLISSASLAADRIVLGSGENQITFADSDTSRCTYLFQKKGDTSTARALTPRGACCELDSFTVQRLKCLPEDTKAGAHAFLSENGKIALTSGPIDKTPIFWDVSTMTRYALEGYSFDPRIVLSSDCKRSAQFTQFLTSEGDASAVIQGMTPDGKWLLRFEDSTIILENSEDPKLFYRLIGHSLPPNALSISPDGDWLLSHRATKVLLWDLRNKEGREGELFFPCACLQGHGQEVKKLHITSDWAISSSADETLIWDLFSYKEAPLKAPRCEIYTSPDEKFGSEISSQKYAALLPYCSLPDNLTLAKSIQITGDGRFAMILSDCARIWDIAPYKDLSLWQLYLIFTMKNTSLNDRDKEFYREQFRYISDEYVRNAVFVPLEGWVSLAAVSNTQYKGLQIKNSLGHSL